MAAAALGVGGHQALAGESQPVNPRPAASTAPASFADIVARVAPAVVSIDVEGKRSARIVASGARQPFGGFGPFGDLRRFFPDLPQATPQPRSGTASGFFISPDGYILTNNHVVEGAERITVRTPDDRTLTARLVGRDPATDLAVVKVEGRDFRYVDFEDRAKPRVGDWVVAVGNPFNLGGTATAGIVSALSRTNVSGSSYVDYLQIDAPINRGNSGGPTFDLEGRVVGVNTAIFSPSGGSVGIGFDIPAEVADRVSRELIAHGKVTRGYIGATVQDVSGDIAEALGVAPKSGALVGDVETGGPSARAGLQSGDIVVAVDGKPIRSAAELTRRIAQVPPGTNVTLDVRRAGRAQTLTLRSAERPSEVALASDERGAQAGTLGLLVSPNAGGGLRIDAVTPGSEAARKGLRTGDVIEQIGGRPPLSAADVRAAVDAARSNGRKSVLLQVSRGGRHLFVAVSPGIVQG